MRILVCFVILFLINSCSPNKRISVDSIIGKWKSIQCSLGFIHGSIHFPISDNMENIKGCFNYKRLEVEFYPDSTYQLNNQFYSSERGRYNVYRDTIELNGIDFSPVKFSVDSLVNNRLYLRLDRNCFFSVKNDTVHLLTGENVKMVLERL